MKPTISLDRSIVAINLDGTVHVMCEVTAPPAPKTERAPLDVVVVLDRSGSMSGAPLAAVTDATVQLLRLLGPHDRLGVVAFDDTVRTVLPLARHTDHERAGRLVRSIDAGGSTNLSGGWLKALEMLSTTGRADALRRIVVLTDGHANAGITGIDQLGPIVAGGRREGITSTFIGFDDGYDENLLAGLADAGAGNDYWCAGPDQAPAVFSAEFEGLASVVAQNVSVSIEPAPEVAAVTVLNDFPLTNHDNGSIEVALGDAYGDETRRVLFSLHLRPVPTGGHLDVATLTIRWASTSGDIALHTLSVPVRIEIGRPGQHDPGADPRVAEEVVILHAARARHEARNFAENGDFESAARLLSDAADNLEGIGTRPAEVTELRADAAELTERRWSRADSKRIYSTSRSITKGRRQRFDHKPSEPDEV